MGATPDRLGNVIAQEGCDRCWCGCKYWENDRCIDCGTYIIDIKGATTMPKLTTRQADKLIEASQNAVAFAVVGSGDFPFDMLRYDLCWPATEKVSLLMGYTGMRRIDLRGLKLPTAGRWKSFGWQIAEQTS